MCSYLFLQHMNRPVFPQPEFHHFFIGMRRISFCVLVLLWFFCYLDFSNSCLQSLTPWAAIFFLSNNNISFPVATPFTGSETWLRAYTPSYDNGGFDSSSASQDSKSYFPEGQTKRGKASWLWIELHNEIGSFFAKYVKITLACSSGRYPSSVRDVAMPKERTLAGSIFFKNLKIHMVVATFSVPGAGTSRSCSQGKRYAWLREMWWGSTVHPRIASKLPNACNHSGSAFGLFCNHLVFNRGNVGVQFCIALSGLRILFKCSCVLRHVFVAQKWGDLANPDVAAWKTI